MSDLSSGAAAIEWPRVGSQLPKQTCGPIDAHALRRYAHVSQDDNPLHLDLGIAQQAGLEERPIHGMLIMSHFEPMIYAWRPDLVLSSLSSKFLRPVLAGQSFELSGRVMRVTGGESPSIVLRLMAHGQGRDPTRDLALVAEAKLVPPCEVMA